MVDLAGNGELQGGINDFGRSVGRSTRSRGGRGLLVGLIAISLALGVVIALPNSPASAAPCTDVWSGTGTSGDPYLITSRADLVAIDTCLQGGNSAAGLYFRQWGDISLGTWTPIGFNASTYFGGTYDGDCYSLSGMSATGDSDRGLFAQLGATGSPATIKNLKMVNPTVTGAGDAVGVLAGSAKVTGNVVDTVIVTGATVSAGTYDIYIGGLIGYDKQTTLTKVSVAGTITAAEGAGLVGANAGAISESSFTGTLTTSRSGAYGLAHNPLSISDSYIQATIAATSAKAFNRGASGIVGSMSSPKTIANSYAAATVSGSNTAPTGTVSATNGSGTSATLTIINANGGAWGTMVPLPITATDGAGSVGTGTTAGVRTQGSGGSGVEYYYPLTGTGLRDGSVTNITYSGIQAGFIGDGTGVTATDSFFDSTLAPTPASGVLSTDGTNFNTNPVSGVTPKSTLDMKTASTYSAWSSSIWDLPATPGAKYPTHKWVSTFAPGCSSGNPAPTPPAPPAPPAPPSGGGSSTPVVDPTPTPTPTPSASVAGNLDAIPNQVNPNIPAGGVPQGGSVFLVNGQPVPVTVAPNAQRNATSLEVSGPDFFMRLQGQGDDADPLGLTPKNALILQSPQQQAPQGRSGMASVSDRGPGLVARAGALAKCTIRQPMAVSSGTGFQANSSVKMYILPSTYVGSLATDASGAYSGSLPVPVGVRTGGQTLQVNGFAPSGAVRSLSLGIEVTPGRTVTTKTARGKVFFDPLSAVIGEAGKKDLNALVRKAKKNGVRTVVVGFVQQTTSTSNDQSLSSLRARNVAAYLRSKGLKGSYAIRGNGVAGPGDPARRVQVTVTYQTGC